MNTWAVSFMTCGTGIVKWTKSQLDEIDRKTRKVMTRNKELHPRSDVDRLYISGMEGGRGLIGCKICVKTEKNSFGWYVKHHIEHLALAVRISNTLTIENSTKPKKFKKQDKRESNPWTIR